MPIDRNSLIAKIEELAEENPKGYRYGICRYDFQQNNSNYLAAVKRKEDNKSEIYFYEVNTSSNIAHIVTEFPHQPLMITKPLTFFSELSVYKGVYHGKEFPIDTEAVGTEVVQVDTLGLEKGPAEEVYNRIAQTIMNQ